MYYKELFVLVNVHLSFYIWYVTNVKVFILFVNMGNIADLLTPINN